LAGTALTKRELMVVGGAAALAAGLPTLPALAQAPVAGDKPWAKTWDAALATLAANVQVAPRFDQPVLFEAPIFKGLWLECGPHESLAYAQMARSVAPAAGRPSPWAVARNSHRIFFANQRPDGQLPASANHYAGLDWSKIQMVVPIAATALEVARALKDEAFLLEAYTACGRWDDWLVQYRNTRGTGLVEAFCTFDTGQDNSPRWKGVANECPDKDARKFAPRPSIPRLCPDLSATAFGGRVALAAMARALGKPAEARAWAAKAEQIRRRILDTLWCEEDASFYDVAPDGSFVKVRSVANLRVLGEHVLRLDAPRERRMFEAMWTRQLHNPKAYWANYPFPSIALDDPKFVRPIPFNSWGGAVQALTALRTLRWMDHYGKSKAQDVVAERWCDAILRGGFCQQIDPETGEATKANIHDYSPAALAFLHFAKRLGQAPGPSAAAATARVGP